MQTTNSIELKCECKIPFHTELVIYLEQELGSALQNNTPIQEIPHKETIMQAIQSRMLFVKIEDPLKMLLPRLVKRLKRIFKKDFVGTIKAGKNEITLILI